MSGPAERRGGASTQQLVQLVLDPRDRGYEDAARRNGGQPATHWYDRPAVAVGALVIGFVLAIAWVHTTRGAPEATKVHNSLVSRVRAAEKSANGLEHTESRLNSELNSVRNPALSGAGALAQQLRTSQLAAGTSAATGPGLEVRLAEPKAPTHSSSPDAAGRTPTEGGHVLVDTDVRGVVNQLWSDGAEAIAVNGIRITPTSAVREAGDAVLVDFQPISSPYRVEAIGDADGLATGFAGSDVASRFQTLQSAKGISFSFTEKSRLTLPAGPLAQPRYAVRTKGK